MARVGIQFEIDANGILHVLARDTKTGKQQIVEMKSAVDVDDAAVQKMVEESVEHAFDDLAARRWVEARLKADQLISAARKGIADAANEIEAEYLAQIQTALRTAEAAITEDSETKTGDIRKLHAACAALDEVTKPLAETLMNRAMDALLRKRGVIP
jgi:molecular chaperone DnaK